jgi:hypothetical protein
MAAKYFNTGSPATYPTTYVYSGNFNTDYRVVFGYGYPIYISNFRGIYGIQSSPIYVYEFNVGMNGRPRPSNPNATGITRSTIISSTQRYIYLNQTATGNYGDRLYANVAGGPGALPGAFINGSPWQADNWFLVPRFSAQTIYTMRRNWDVGYVGYVSSRPGWYITNTQ